MIGKYADMRHEEYWIKRFEQLEESQIRKGIEYYNDLTKQYMKAIASVEKDLAKWYTRYANENGISLTEAKRLLNSRELAEFRMDVKEYIKKGESLNHKWTKQLEAASTKFHVSRLEALKVQMQQQAELVCGGQLDDIDALARKIYTDGYYHTAYEIQKGIGVGWDLMALDTNKIDNLISKPWASDGKNFSERIWGNRTQLVHELENTLTQSIIRGQSPKKVIAEIAQRFNVSKSRAGALVMTEGAFFASAAQRDCFNDLDVERFEVVATLDSRTSPTCRHMDGKVLPMSEYKPGVTAPPFHVRCRSTTVPYFDDEFTLVEERAARDENGNYYTVPAQMKYEDWKDIFVDKTKTYSDWKAEWFMSNVLNTPKNAVNYNAPKKDEEKQEELTFKPVETIDEAISFAKNLVYEDDFAIDDGLGVHTVNDFVKAMYDVNQKFGRKLKISGIKRMSDTNKRVMNASYSSRDGKITLKNTTFAQMKKSAEKQYNIGYWATKNPYGSNYHEIGHAVWVDLPKEAQEKISDIYSRIRHESYLEWMEMGGNRASLKQSEVFAKQLSKYGSKNKEEFFSEAFSQIMDGDMKSAAREVNKVLDEYYSKKVISQRLKSLNKLPLNDKIRTGATAGALNPSTLEAFEHAERFYEEIRKRKSDVAVIAQRTGLTEEYVQIVKNHIFIDKHDLGRGVPEHFFPDYEMAQSWQRLSDKKMKIQEHDIILLKHEYLEHEYMAKGMTQAQAHNEAEKLYSYRKALLERK